jgi:signal transduction histidine kinase
VIPKIRRHLGVKFFISYFVVICVGILVLISASQFTVPRAFERHMTEMTDIMGDQAATLEADLYVNFQKSFRETLAFSAAAAFITAVLASFLVTRQVVAPIRKLQEASRYIADGHYDERVQVSQYLDRNDLDELDQLAVSFNQMTLRLEQAEVLRKQLIGDIAHELRTPLSTIKGSLEGLIDGVLPPERDTYHQVYQEAERLQRLVDDLQDLNLVESGAFQLDPERINPTAIIDFTLTRLSRQFDEKGVFLINKLPRKLPDVIADRDRLGQVFTNLIGNALQYTPSGGEVQIASRQVGHRIQIQVIDNGIGISADDLPNIFTRFYRVDKSRSRAGGGSGIGLTIAKHLVESQGGRIWVSSPGLDQGSVFTVELPLA